MRTWLGYVTNPAPGSGANGTAKVSGDATLLGPAGAPVAQVDGTLPRGGDQLYTFGFPVASAGSTYDLETGVGTVETTGTTTFASTAHGFNLTVDNPKVVLNGESGQLFASGAGSNAATADKSYDRSAPVFDLDLKKATIARNADGTYTVGPIAPRVGTATYLFPANYVLGAGPERTPNTFGSFSLRVRLAYTAPADGKDGKNGANGTNGTNGMNGKDGATGPKGATGKAGSTRVIAVLRKAPFAGGATRKVSVLKNGKTVATGTLQKKTLTVTVAKGKKVSAGTYVLKSGSAKKTIKIG
jgi:hypothetical protein